MKIFKKIRSSLMGYKVANLLTNTNFSELAKILTKEGEKHQCMLRAVEVKGEGFVLYYRYGTKHVFYLGCVRFLIDDGPDKLVKVSILDESKSSWYLSQDVKKNGEWIIDSPTAKCFDVYTYCQVKLPTGRVVNDERYTKGTWDEYVFLQVSKIIERIYSYKERNQYNLIYESKNCKQV